MPCAAPWRVAVVPTPSQAPAHATRPVRLYKPSLIPSVSSPTATKYKAHAQKYFFAVLAKIRESQTEMAVCSSSSRVAALVLVSLVVAALFVSVAPPCAAAARVLLADRDGSRAGGEAARGVGRSGDNAGSPAAMATGSGFRGSPDFAGGRTAATTTKMTTTKTGNAARVLGSVPSPGVGH
ncbi:hypothetical protein ACP4OV_030602 [Aristida adscensionis]